MNDSSFVARQTTPSPSPRKTTTRSKVLKALRSIDDHGHDLTCITSAQQAQLAPATVTGHSL